MDLLDNLKAEDLRIIGQSAEKSVIFFFHTRARRIVCFDQHAVDERIRYERLLDRADHMEDDLDSLKSKACHGAVRFGDKLTFDKCLGMIRQLLKCKVPFRCAHARRSVCVLGSLDEELFTERMKWSCAKRNKIQINSST